MTYIICDDKNHYLHCTASSKFKVVSSIKEATKWKRKQTVNNILIYNCNRKDLKEFSWKAKYLTPENEMTEEPAGPVDLDFDILDKIKEISSFTKQLENRRLYLIEEIHNADLEIVDIEHAAEFYNLNASEGYKLYKLLHEVRIKRRNLKDELQKIELILGCSMKSSNIENLEKSVLGLDTRKYTPRINKELFKKEKCL